MSLSYDNITKDEIYVCLRNKIKNEEVIVNTRLIAAAPDLLEVCKEALDVLNFNEYEGYIGLKKKLREAIGKALIGNVNLK